MLFVAVIAALLHDIGKFTRLGEVNIQSNAQPQDDSSYTSYFIEKALPLPYGLFAFKIWHLN